MLILMCLIGVLGLFYFNDFIKKISYLAVSYSSFIILISFIAQKNIKLDEIMVVIISITIIFSINLLIGIGIIKQLYYFDLKRH